jgi:hypothetical protein
VGLDVFIFNSHINVFYVPTKLIGNKKLVENYTSIWISIGISISVIFGFRKQFVKVIAEEFIS